MKRGIWLVVLTAFACTMATALWAEGEPNRGAERPAAKEPEQPRAQGVREGEPNALRLPDAAAKIDRAVAFTDEQKAQVIELNKARDAAVKALNAKFEADLVALMSPEQKAKWDAAVKPKDGERREGDRPKEGATPKAEGEPR